MSTSVVFVGKPDTARLITVGTSAETLVDGGDNGMLVDHIRINNATAGSINVTLDIYNGTTAYQLLTTHTLVVAGTESTEEGIPKSVYVDRDWHWIPGGSFLRVTGTALGLHCFASTVGPLGAP